MGGRLLWLLLTGAKKNHVKYSLKTLPVWKIKIYRLVVMLFLSGKDLKQEVIICRESLKKYHTYMCIIRTVLSMTAGPNSIRSM